MSAALRKIAPVRAASISRGEDGVGAGAAASPVPALRRRRTTLREDGGGAAALPAEGVPIAGGCATAGCPATERLLVTVRLRLPNRVLMHCPYRLWGRAHNRDGPKIFPHGFGAFSGRRAGLARGRDRRVFSRRWAARVTRRPETTDLLKILAP